MSKVSFALLIHSHQPVGNFDHVFEEAYRKAYRPFVEALEAHSRIRLSLHFSGILLEWLERHQPQFFSRLHWLVERKQVELVGGGFYEPILPSIPDADKIAQVKLLSSYLTRHFGAPPRGAWVAERVWEPALAAPLAEAGVEYAMLDDTHFLAVGLDPAELHGVYITEEMGEPLKLVPSLKSLRYTIPFREPEETLSILREGLKLESRLFAMGDDCEKFGVWPGTFDHCYTNGWLEKFLTAVEGASEWLETTTVGDYLASHEPEGRVYLPTASYPEMMEWALPPAAAKELKAVTEESNHAPGGERLRRFLRGGVWRNFLSKYPESNQTHKLMLGISRRWHEATRSAAAEPEATRLSTEAQKHLLAGQCNDAYWHGVFGGLYAPHLRSALLRHLIQAEVLLDKLEAPGAKKRAEVRTKDFDADGHTEVLAEHPCFGLILRPADGGTVSSLRYKPADAELVNSLARRPEAYHDLVRQRSARRDNPGGAPASIHDRVTTKEENLAELLRYDRYLRHAFRHYLFPAGKGLGDFENLSLEENSELAAGKWMLARTASMPEAIFELEAAARLADKVGGGNVQARKVIRSSAEGEAWTLECRTALALAAAPAASMALGVEIVLNLLAPNALDRYFLDEDTRWPLSFRGEIKGDRLALIDEWQRVRVELEAPAAARWWVVPIETVSQSEAGFERVYQGSAIMPVWAVSADPAGNFSCRLRARVSLCEETG